VATEPTGSKRQPSDSKQVLDLLDVVVRFHGAQPAVVEGAHEEALGEVVEVLAEREDVVAVGPRGRVQPAALHAAAERAHGRARLLQRRRLLQYGCQTNRGHSIAPKTTSANAASARP